MRYLIRDLRANKLYYTLLTFSLTIFSLATSLSITSFIDYYEKYLGSLVGNSKYIYEMQLDSVNNDDLSKLTTFTQENFNDINIITDINLSDSLFKIYVFNYKGWNNEIIDGDKLDINTNNVVVTDNNYKIGDSIELYPYNYEIIGKIDVNKYPDLEKYIYIPYDSERDKIGSDISTVSGVLNLLICSNRKIDTEIDMIKGTLIENNEKLKVNILNKKTEFIKKCFRRNTYFFTRVLYSLCLILICLINLILFLSYFNTSKRKETYTKRVLGASNFSIIVNEFIRLSICVIISSFLALGIQHILNINGIKTKEIPMDISMSNIILVPIISIILISMIVKFIYHKDNISSILKE